MHCGSTPEEWIAQSRCETISVFSQNESSGARASTALRCVSSSITRFWVEDTRVHVAEINDRRKEGLVSSSMPG